jgi:hypothetical protein
MKKMLYAVPAAVLAGLLGVAGHARACYPDMCCQPQIAWVDQVVTCYRTETRERVVPCTIQKTVCREEAVVSKSWVNVPTWSEQKRTVWVYKEVCKPVEREITCQLPLPPAPCPTCSESCGSCGHHCDICDNRVPATYKQKISCIEHEAAPEKVDFVEKVCTYKAEERTSVSTRHVVESIPETVLRHETYCVTVPYQVTIKVPVCAPAGCCH